MDVCVAFLQGAETPGSAQVLGFNQSGERASEVTEVGSLPSGDLTHPAFASVSQLSLS